MPIIQRKPTPLSEALEKYGLFDPEQAFITPAYLSAAQRAALQALGAEREYLDIAARVPRKIGQAIKKIVGIEEYGKGMAEPELQHMRRWWSAAIRPISETEYMVGINPRHVYRLAPRHGAESYLHEAGHALEDWIAKKNWDDWLRMWRAANRMPMETVEELRTIRRTPLDHPGEILAEAFAMYKAGSPHFKLFPQTIKHYVKKYSKLAR